MSRTAWAPILDRAAEIVRSYDTSVTLRQLFYRLVSERALPNTDTSYKRLSAKTAELRRDDAFPRLIDRGRSIHRRQHFDGPRDMMTAAVASYRLDRTAGQDVSLYLGVEKAGMVVQLQSWFAHLGVPILALGGYSSQSYVDEITRDVRRYRQRDDGAESHHPRPAVLLYAGDFDPSGEDIDRDFAARTDCWHKVIRVALTAPQVTEFDLPPNPGKATDSRASAFVARHGELVQVELDALPPETLRSLFDDAIADFWDKSTYEAVREREDEHRQQLRAAAAAIEREA